MEKWDGAIRKTEAVTGERTLHPTGDPEEAELRLFFVKELLHNILDSYDAKKASGKSFRKASDGENTGKYEMTEKAQKQVNVRLEEIQSEKTEIKGLSTSRDKEKQAADRTYFDRVNACYDAYSKSLRQFNKNAVSAVKSMETIFSDDYKQVTTAKAYADKSQHIQEMLEIVDVSDVTGSILKKAEVSDEFLLKP